MGKMLTAGQVAEVLGLTPRSIIDLHKAGKLPAVRLGWRTYRFRQTDVEKLIETSMASVPQSD